MTISRMQKDVLASSVVCYIMFVGLYFWERQSGVDVWVLATPISFFCSVLFGITAWKQPKGFIGSLGLINSALSFGIFLTGEICLHTVGQLSSGNIVFAFMLIFAIVMFQVISSEVILSSE